MQHALSPACLVCEHTLSIHTVSIIYLEIFLANESNVKTHNVIIRAAKKKKQQDDILLTSETLRRHPASRETSVRFEQESYVSHPTWDAEDK